MSLRKKKQKQHIPAINSKCFQSVKQILSPSSASRRLINDSFQQHVMAFCTAQQKKGILIQHFSIRNQLCKSTVELGKWNFEIFLYLEILKEFLQSFKFESIAKLNKKIEIIMTKSHCTLQDIFCHFQTLMKSENSDWFFRSRLAALLFVVDLLNVKMHNFFFS